MIFYESNPNAKFKKCLKKFYLENKELKNSIIIHTLNLGCKLET